MNLPTDEIRKLYYEEGLSARKIGEQLDATVWQVLKTMERNNMPRRTQAESNKLTYLAAPPSFNIKRTLTNKEKRLKIAGLMLYLGEGAKSGNTVDLANSNSAVVSLFVKMLRDIYRVDEKRLRVYLYCYANQNPKVLIKYWSSLIQIDKLQFSKPYVRQDFLTEKLGKMPYGLIHIRYSDKKLLERITEDIKKIFMQI